MRTQVYTNVIVTIYVQVLYNMNYTSMSIKIANPTYQFPLPKYMYPCSVIMGMLTWQLYYTGDYTAQPVTSDTDSGI